MVVVNILKLSILLLFIISFQLESATKLKFSVDQIGSSYIIFNESHLIINNDDSSFADILYNHNKKEFYIFNKNDNTFIPFTENDITQLKKDILSKIEQMNKEIESTPDSVFKDADIAKSKQMTLFEDAFIVLNTPEKDTLLNMEVSKHKVISDDVIYMDVWGATPNKCGITKKEFEVYYSFSKLFRTYLTGVTLNMESWISPYFVDVKEIPIKTVNKISGIESQIIKIEHPKYEEKYFSIPETYKEKDVPFRK